MVQQTMCVQVAPVCFAGPTAYDVVAAPLAGHLSSRDDDSSVDSLCLPLLGHFFLSLWAVSLVGWIVWVLSFYVKI
jgi:hypothetical protein